MLPPTTPTLSAATLLVNILPDAQNPTSNYWSLSIQRQVHSNYIFELGYNGNRSYHLIRQSQDNLGILSEAKAAAVIAGCTSANLATCQDPAGFPISPSRLDPNWGPRILLETTGTGEYNGMYVQVNGRTALGCASERTTPGARTSATARSSPTTCRSSSAGILRVPARQYHRISLNRRNEWSRSVFDSPHRCHDQLQLRNSVGSDRRHAILNHILNGWQ